MSEDIYTQFGIDKSRLKRDYIENPLNKKLRKIENPYKEDLEYLYIELNLSLNEMSSYFNVSISTIRRLLSKYKIHKSLEKIEEKSKQRIQQLYGVDNVFQLDWVKEKSKDSNKKKYGTDFACQNKEIKEQIKKTTLEKYGKEYYTQTDEYMNRIQKTNQHKYGVEYVLSSPIIRNKIKQTCIERYGVEYISQLDSWKEKCQNTCEEKYNYKTYIGSKEYYTKKNDIVKKQYETKRKNGTFGKSKEEDNIFNILKMRFSEVKRQYKSDKYPFACDFYIPEIDTYIEYQGFWTHGKEPYIGTDEQKERVKILEAKNTKYNLKAIKTWTISDPLKREIAKKNNLKWLEFFNMTQFMKWFENYSI